MNKIQQQFSEPVLDQPLWCIIDTRTGERVSVAGFLSQRGAEEQIEAWRDRDRLGGRPDVHLSMPYLAPKKL